MYVMASVCKIHAETQALYSKTRQPDTTFTDPATAHKRRQEAACHMRGEGDNSSVVCEAGRYNTEGENINTWSIKMPIIVQSKSTTVFMVG